MTCTECCVTIVSGIFGTNLLVGFHLPDKQHCPIQFMREVMSGEKKVSNTQLMLVQALKLVDIKMMIVPHYETLSIRQSFKAVLNSYPTLFDYFPMYTSNYVPGRRHFWEVFGTLFHEDALRFIDEERTKRYEREEEEMNKNMKIDPVIYEQIMNCKYFSKKKGRALFANKPRETDLPHYRSDGERDRSRVIKGLEMTQTPKERRSKGTFNRSKAALSTGQMIDMQNQRDFNDSGQKFQTPSNKRQSPFDKRNNAEMHSAD